MAKHRIKTCKFPYCLNICYVKCFVESFAKDRRSRQNRNAHSLKYFHNKHFQGNSGRSFSKKTDTSNDVSDNKRSIMQRQEMTSRKNKCSRPVR